MINKVTLTKTQTGDWTCVAHADDLNVTVLSGYSLRDAAMKAANLEPPIRMARGSLVPLPRDFDLSDVSLRDTLDDIEVTIVDGIPVLVPHETSLAHEDTVRIVRG